MLTRVFSVLAACTLLATFGCGDDDDSNSPTHNEGGACGSQVIDDYNNVVIACSLVTTASEKQDCDSKADSFESSYPNINCSALKLTGTEAGDTDTITSADVDSLREEGDLQYASAPYVPTYDPTPYTPPLYTPPVYTPPTPTYLPACPQAKIDSTEIAGEIDAMTGDVRDNDINYPQIEKTLNYLNTKLVAFHDKNAGIFCADFDNENYFLTEAEDIIMIESVAQTRPSYLKLKKEGKL